MLLDGELLCNNLTWKSDTDAGFYLVPGKLLVWDFTSYKEQFSKKRLIIFKWLYSLYVSCLLYTAEDNDLQLSFQGALWIFFVTLY